MPVMKSRCLQRASLFKEDSFTAEIAEAFAEERRESSLRLCGYL